MLKTEVLLALAGYFGEVIALDDAQSQLVVAESVAFANAGEREAVTALLLPLAYYHWCLRRWVDACDEPSCGLYQRTLALAVERALLRPYATKLLDFERDLGALTYTHMRVRLDAELHTFAHAHALLASLAQEGLTGPQLLTRLHDGLHATGVPELRTLFTALLAPLQALLHRQLSTWMLRGTLCDPYGEFFVQQRRIADADMLDAWNSYYVDTQLVPTHVALVDARKVLFVGQCAAVLQQQPPEPPVDEFSTRSVAQVAELARASASQQLLALVRTAGLAQHLRTVRRVLLMGDGALFARLLATLAPVLARSPTSTAQRELNASWKLVGGDAAVLLTWDGNYANRWDGVAAEWAVPFPLSLVLSSERLAALGAVFATLFKVARAHAACTAAWWHYRRTAVQWRELHRTMAVSMHALRYHFAVDVVDVHYRALEDALHAAADHDAAVAALDTATGRMAAGVLLTSSPLRRCLDEVLEAVLEYCARPLDVSHGDRAAIATDFQRQSALLTDLLAASNHPTLLSLLRH